jgi:hypothetical protein
MATIQPIALNYSELIMNPSMILTGKTWAIRQSELLPCTSTGGQMLMHLTQKRYKKTYCCFTRLVVGVIAFVEGTRYPTGVLKVLHGFQRFVGVPGKTDEERKQVFC